MGNLYEYKQEVYSTTLDVRLLSDFFIAKLDHSDKIAWHDNMVEVALMRARGIIDLKLGQRYSGTSTFEVTPYCSPGLLPKANEEGSGENSGSGVLHGASPASTARTELWTFTFTSATAYNVSGSLSGSQTAGSTSSDYTSDNNFLVVESDAWSGTPESGDVIYLMTYKYHNSIVAISTMLAMGLIFKSIAADASGALADGIQLYSDALALLDDIEDGNGDLLGVDTTVDARDLLVPYEVSRYGYDITGYRTDEFDRYASEGTRGRYNVWWLF